MYSKKAKKKLAVLLPQIGTLLTKGQRMSTELALIEKRLVNLYDRLAETMNAIADKAASKYDTRYSVEAYDEILSLAEASYSRVDFEDGLPLDWEKALANFKKMKSYAGKLEKLEARDIATLRKYQKEEREAKKRERAEKLKAQRAAKRAAAQARTEEQAAEGQAAEEQAAEGQVTESSGS